MTKEKSNSGESYIPNVRQSSKLADFELRKIQDLETSKKSPFSKGKTFQLENIPELVSHN